MSSGNYLYSSSLPAWCAISGAVIFCTGIIGIVAAEKRKRILNLTYLILCLVSVIQGMTLIIAGSVMPHKDMPLITLGTIIFALCLAAITLNCSSIWEDIE